VTHSGPEAMADDGRNLNIIQTESKVKRDASGGQGTVEIHQDAEHARAEGTVRPLSDAGAFRFFLSFQNFKPLIAYIFVFFLKFPGSVRALSG